jgi:NitT/TauT family transport system substrate-binding protein
MAPGARAEAWSGLPLRRRTLGALGVVATAWLGGCTPLPSRPLMVGMNAWVGYDPLVLARDLRLLDVPQVKLVELASSSETLRHFRNGLIDAAALTLDETLRLADEGQDVRLVAVLSVSAGADVVMAAPEIRTPAQLRGVAIAVEQSTVGALMLQRLLQAGGLQVTDVTVVNMEATRHLQALRSQRVQAAISYVPLSESLRAAGYRALFDSRAMPGDIVDVLVVRGSVLQDRAPQVDALLWGWQRGWAALMQDTPRASALLAPGVDLSPTDYRATLAGLRFLTPAQSLAWLSGQPLGIAHNAERLALTLQAMGLIRERPDWGRLVAPEAAQRLVDGGAR